MTQATIGYNYVMPKSILDRISAIYSINYLKFCLEVIQVLIESPHTTLYKPLARY